MKPILHRYWLLGSVQAETIGKLESEGWLLIDRWKSGAEFQLVSEDRLEEPDLSDSDCVKVFKVFREGNGCGDGSMDVVFLSVREHELCVSNFHIYGGSDFKGESNEY